jgi:hypothetical protein
VPAPKSAAVVSVAVNGVAAIAIETTATFESARPSFVL